MKIQKSSECLVYIHSFIYITLIPFAIRYYLSCGASEEIFLPARVQGPGFLRLRKKHPLQDGISGAGKEVELINIKTILDKI